VPTPGNARVLLVDDVPEVRTLVRRALELRGGFEVVGEASRGVAAVTLVDELAPDIVVLDLGLPDITGRDVLTRVHERRPDTKIVIFSGVDPADRTWYEERAEGYVLKDADIDYLVDLLVSIVQAHADTEAVLALPEDLSSMRDARHFVADTLSSWGVDSVVDEAAVVVTELAANAVIHARSDYEVRLSLTPQAVRIEVADRGPGTPEPLPPTTGGESGRGLLMVAALSVSWGVESDPDGLKVVWSELARDGEESAVG
jgi:DNA-binding NarL/FixJ family response regulator